MTSSFFIYFTSFYSGLFIIFISSLNTKSSRKKAKKNFIATFIVACLKLWQHKNADVGFSVFFFIILLGKF